MAAVVASYLAKDPEHRPDSAVALRRALADAYGIEVEARLEQLSEPSAVRLNALGFVCRESELDVAERFLNGRLRSSDRQRGESSAESPTLLVISGEPGAGKTSMMQEISRRALGKGCRVYEGRCFDGNVSPFQPFIEIIRHLFSGLKQAATSADTSTMLVDHVSRRANESKQIEAILLDYRQELLRVAPELRRWLPGQAQEPAFRHDTDYIVRSLATMFIEISQVRPLFFCLDDIQWADQSTLALLQHLAATLDGQSHAPSDPEQKQVSPPQHPELVLACNGRSGYEQLTTFLSRAESRFQAAVIELDLFGPAETRQMLSLRLGCLPGQIDDELVATIDSLCHGNPFFISETVREWYARGMIVRAPEGWKTVRKSEDDSSLPTSVRSALRGRVSELSETAQTLVPVAAAIGRVVDLDLLTAVVPDVSEVDLLDGVDELLTKRILVETNTASRLEFSHDLMRELVLAELTGSRRRAIHRRIADAIEKQLGGSSKSVSNALLAMHYRAGEMSEKAFAYAVKAGQDALRAYAFEDALAQLRQAEELHPTELTAEARFEMYGLLAEAHAGCDQLNKAITAAQSALSNASGPMEKGRMISKIAWYEQKRGELVEAWRRFDEALTVLGVNRPKSPLLVMLSTQINLFYFHFVPKPILRFFIRQRITTEQLPELLCQVYYDLAHIVGSRNLFQYLQICALNAATSRVTPSGNAKCHALAKYGLNLGFSGITFLSLRYAKQAIASANRDARPEIAAMGRSSVSACLLFAGKLDEAEREAMDSIEVLKRCGDHHASYAYHWLRHIYSVRGNSRDIIEVVNQEVSVATKTADKELIGYGLYGLAHGFAISGQFDQALEAGKKSVGLLTETECGFRAIAQMEYGFALMQASRYAEAVESLKTAISIMNRYLHYFEIHMPVFPRLAEALLGPNWVTIHGSANNVREAKRYVGRGKMFSRVFPNIRPHAWRMMGRYQFAAGKSQKARKSLERAIAEAEKLGARYELARAHDDLGRAFPELAQHRDLANKILTELDAVIPEAERRH